MSYYMALRVKENEVLTVALPDKVSWTLFAEFWDLSPLAIIGLELPDGDPLPGNLCPVAPELAVLLGSAEDYPPALALARGGLWQRYRELSRDGLPLDSDTFQRELATLLRYHLDSQPNAPYMLAKAVCGSAYIQEGAYCWLVGFEPQENCVWWVSDDYHVYQDDIEVFDVTREQVSRLPNPVHQMCD